MSWAEIIWVGMGRIEITRAEMRWAEARSADELRWIELRWVELKMSWMEPSWDKLSWAEYVTCRGGFSDTCFYQSACNDVTVTSAERTTTARSLPTTAACAASTKRTARHEDVIHVWNALKCLVALRWKLTRWFARCPTPSPLLSTLPLPRERTVNKRACQVYRSLHATRICTMCHGDKETQLTNGETDGNRVLTLLKSFFETCLSGEHVCTQMQGLKLSPFPYLSVLWQWAIRPSLPNSSCCNVLCWVFTTALLVELHCRTQ